MGAGLSGPGAGRGSAVGQPWLWGHGCIFGPVVPNFSLS